MSPRPHEGPAEEGLSSPFLRIVHDPGRVESLRAVLSGFSHRCRNSLNGINMSLYLFRREARGTLPDCWTELETLYHGVERMFDHLQAIYRPIELTTTRSRLDELIAHHVPRWRSWFESRGQSLHLSAPDAEVVGDFDPAYLGTGLDAMALWRAQLGVPGAGTRICWDARDGWIEIQWEELTSGALEPLPERADGSAAGHCGSASRGADALALPVMARIVAEHGGRLHVPTSQGQFVRARWPQFQPPAVRNDA